ncbi:MAG: 50S ribosomal protein L11 methyltransferase [Pseudomonadota bacterium]
MAAGYQLDQFGLMVDCEPRMAAYAEALKRAVTPGCTVIDIGAGFGIFSLLACKYGAREVVAIEPDPSVELVLPIARANGFADRITVIRDLSTRFTPERKADVLVSDIRGVTPLFQHHIPTIIDARERLLAPGGHQIPLRDRIVIAPVHAPRHYLPCERPWLANNFALDLTEGHRFVVNIPAAARLDREAIMAEPQSLAVLDYRTITNTDVDSTVEFTTDRPATCHGFLVWFEAEIAEGLGFSNGPGEAELVYPQYFLPLERPLTLHAQQPVSARVSARLIDGDYIWSWETFVEGSSTGDATQRFSQSSFKGKIFSPQNLKPLANNHIPEMTEAMAIDRDCLSLVGEERDLQEIASCIFERHTEHFESEAHALVHVARVLKRYR